MPARLEIQRWIGSFPALWRGRHVSLSATVWGIIIGVRTKRNGSQAAAVPGLLFEPEKVTSHLREVWLGLSYVCCLLQAYFWIKHSSAWFNGLCIPQSLKISLGSSEPHSGLSSYFVLCSQSVLLPCPSWVRNASITVGALGLISFGEGASIPDEGVLRYCLHKQWCLLHGPGPLLLS